MEMPLGYDEDEVEIRFTRAELDMLMFACLHHIGHPVARTFALGENGHKTLMKALDKINALFEEDETNGEPDVVSPA